MKRKTQSPKRILAFLLLPLFTILTASAAYGTYENYAAFKTNLIVAQKPTITVTCTLVNTYNNSINALVNSTTRIIQTTEPALPILYINITNTGETPIDKITLNDTIPSDWTLRQINMRLSQPDQTQIEISAPDFTIQYNPEIGIAMLTFDVRNTLGKTFNQYESMLITLYIEYNLLGQPMPNDYETNPPTYTNTVAVSEWTGNWQDHPTITTLAFSTNMTEF
jgi:hypothetical protein